MKRRNLYFFFFALLSFSCFSQPSPSVNVPDRTMYQPPIVISAFQADRAGYEADAECGWVHVIICDPAILASTWSVYGVGDNNERILLLSSAALSKLPWKLGRGDCIRIHPSNGYCGRNDSSLDNRGGDDIYDCTIGNGQPGFISLVRGVLWVEDGAGEVLYLVSYLNLNRSDGTGFLGSGTFPQSVTRALNSAVSQGLWPSAKAVFSYDAAEGFAHVSYSKTVFISPDDWQLAKGASFRYDEYVRLENVAVNPSSVAQGEDVEIAVTLSTFHGATVGSVSFDCFSRTWSAPLVRITENENGVYVYRLSTDSMTPGIYNVYIMVDSDYAEIENEVQFEVMPLHDS